MTFPDRHEFQNMTFLKPVASLTDSIWQIKPQLILAPLEFRSKLYYLMSGESLSYTVLQYFHL